MFNVYNGIRVNDLQIENMFARAHISTHYTNYVIMNFYIAMDISNSAVRNLTYFIVWKCHIIFYFMSLNKI